MTEPDLPEPVLSPEQAARIGEEVAAFAELVATLRRECPWDRKQTHRSLTRHLLEETYEVLDAIEALPLPAAEARLDEGADAAYEHLEEELGDLLFQVAFHSTLAAEQGRFDMADVAVNVREKLRSRHPHVFGDVEVADADEVVANWEQIKKAEKGRDSVFDGIPQHLPSLLYALKVQKKAADLADSGLPVVPAPMVADAAAALEGDPSPETLAALLYATVDVARAHGIDPETALRAAATHHRDDAARLEAGDS